MRDAPEQTVEIADQSPVDVGEIVQGKYRIGPLVGFGGMAAVVAAHHLELDSAVAIKLLLPEHAARPDAVRRFLAEARAAAGLKSEHVARVLDVGTHPTKQGPIIPFMVMELLKGQDLAAVLAVRERLPVHEAVEYVLQACDAVAEAHSLGIVHRDLKPANLFLTRRRDGAPVIKLLDFGISKVSAKISKKNEHAITAEREMMGSPGYMSPEQVRSAKDVDARTDIWSLGVILYELLTGDEAFPAGTIADVFVKILHSPPDPIAMRAPEAPPGLVEIVMRCLQKKRDARYPNVEALAAALRQFRGVAPIIVAPLPAGRASDALAMSDGAISVQTLRDPPQRRVFLTASLAFGAVGIVLIAVASFAKLRAPAQDPQVAAGSTEAPPVATQIAAPPPSATGATAATGQLELPDTAPAEPAGGDAGTVGASSKKPPGPRPTAPVKPLASARHRTDW